jgi:hypothetical protein
MASSVSSGFAEWFEQAIRTDLCTQRLDVGASIVV